MFIHTTESIQPGFGKAPEAFDAVDMSSTSDELILSMVHAQVPTITNVNLIFPRISVHRVKGYKMTRNEVSNEKKAQEF